MNRVSYFILHAHSSAASGEAGVRMTLEDLSTGEKHNFDSSVALGRFLDRWAGLAEQQRFGRPVHRPDSATPG